MYIHVDSDHHHVNVFYKYNFFFKDFCAGTGGANTSNPSVCILYYFFGIYIFNHILDCQGLDCLGIGMPDSIRTFCLPSFGYPESRTFSPYFASVNPEDFSKTP